MIGGIRKHPDNFNKRAFFCVCVGGPVFSFKFGPWESHHLPLLIIKGKIKKGKNQEVEEKNDRWREKGKEKEKIFLQ